MRASLVRDGLAPLDAARDADLLVQVSDLLHQHPELDPDTVRHTLALLRLPPLDRLNRSLIRGRLSTSHRA
jgi:hypothetical protein